VSCLCAPVNRLWAPPHHYRQLFTTTAVALTAASRDLCYLIVILITCPTLQLSYHTFVRCRLWPIRFLCALLNPLAFQCYLLFQFLGSQEPDSLLVSSLQEPNSQLTSGHPLHFQFFTALCSLFSLAVYLLYLCHATTSLLHTHRWLLTNFRPNFLLSGSSCNAVTFCCIFDAYIPSFKPPVTPTPQHSVAFFCPNPYFTMPSKSRKSQPPAPHSSHHKPKLRSSPMPATYLVIDMMLPSSIFSECSLFVTYSPQSRIFHTAFGNDIIIEGTGKVHV